MSENHSPVRVAIAGLGNCAGGLIEGLAHYVRGSSTEGLLFPVLGGYQLSDIEVVCAFDVSARKVGWPIAEALYAEPNNFCRIPGAIVTANGPVLRGPTLDGNPPHLARFVEESKDEPVDVIDALRTHRVDVLLNLLPTGSVEATAFYGEAALEAGCAFVNCIPTIYAQKEDVAARFKEKGLPLLGDDIKSQVGSTILHRAVLHMLKSRGAKIVKSSQVNIGGNTDFANFVYRAETKLVSKYKSLRLFIPDGVPNHVGHHYDPTKGPFKKTLFDVEAEVFGGSSVKISMQLQSDDKPNSAGSVIDLIRIAKYEKDQGHGGVIAPACAYYMKSAPYPTEDDAAYAAVTAGWAPAENHVDGQTSGD